MERIQTLINRLQEQVRQNADVSQMQMTLQLLQSELNQLQKTSVRTLGTSKVSVVLPTRVAITPVSVAKKEVEEEQEVISVPKIKSKPKSQLDLHFDPMKFSQYKIEKEVNEAVEQKESFNDRLKENRNELMHSLKETPIRDLRKGIGINDRFVFISELFRGDEPMYERSIKTINSFNIYPEAEYWMNRELKIKLGWDDTREIVKHFYQLVKRRFASM
ncbi:MAG: hypothetical protein E6H08_02870 [Bacteroidetes bacterium]|nr:MAG: hypothetical protein E6H08_02870 [Bacteroidota bacterium]